MKIYKTLFLGLGLIALSSCSDFLNQTSPSELDNESTFNNAIIQNWHLIKFTAA